MQNWNFCTYYFTAMTLNSNFNFRSIFNVVCNSDKKYQIQFTEKNVKLNRFKKLHDYFMFSGLYFITILEYFL